MRLATALLCSALMSFVVAACEAPDAPAIVVYAARDIDSIRDVLDSYSDATGETVLLITENGRDLIDRLSVEKHRATADLVITDSIAHLWTAKENDNLRPSSSEMLETKGPENLRDPEKFWFALSVIGRTIAYDKRQLGPDEVTSYSALGDDRWRGKLCLTSATDADSQSQIAMMILEHGDRPTEIIVRSWIANLAIPVVKDHTTLLNAIEDGQCSLGIVNSDDLARYSRDKPNTSVARIWPATGAYVSIVGAAVTRHAANPAGALRLLEWLSSNNGQKRLAGPGLTIPVSRWDNRDGLQISLAAAGYYHEDAVKLMERAHYRRAD